jgi:hypothetical protein
MPWEIDYALLTFTQLKKSKYYLPNDVNITIDSVLNLSSYTTDWSKSKLPKEFFIEKYNQISTLLEDYNHNPKIYLGDKLYGHLDLQKECISPEVDYYIGICPDICFSEYALAYLIESTKQIKNKYFLITPQISKVGDSDWDEITNPKYINIPYSDYTKMDVFDIDYDRKNASEEVSLYPTQRPKFAGWFDLYSKSFYEELCPVQEEWTGYGPWDLYSLIILNNIKQYDVDFQQYLLKGETIWMYPSGPLIKENLDGFCKYYKDFLYLHKHKDNQRQIFESKLPEYLNKTFTQLKDKGIINE